MIFASGKRVLRFRGLRCDRSSIRRDRRRNGTGSRDEQICISTACAAETEDRKQANRRNESYYIGPLAKRALEIRLSHCEFRPRIGLLAETCVHDKRTPTERDGVTAVHPNWPTSRERSLR